MRRIKERRQNEFRKQFHVDETDCMDYMMGDMPTKLIYRKNKDGPKSKVMSAHSKDSGFELGITLMDDTPIIPDIDDQIDPQSPMKTVIIL